jgi:phage baseplate assembly protein W
MIPQDNRWLSSGIWGDAGTPVVTDIRYITEQIGIYYTKPHMLPSPCRPIISITDAVMKMLDLAKGSVDISIQVSEDGEAWLDTEPGVVSPIIANMFRYKVVMKASSLLGAAFVDSITTHVTIVSYEQAVGENLEIDTVITSIIWGKPSIIVTPPPVTIPDHTLEFLGKGLRFPFTFQVRSGGAQISTATSSDHAHIHESIKQIFGTKKGERFMRPEFGTRLHELVFERNDRLLYGLIRHEVIDALDTWEPRVIIRDVVVGSDSTDDHLVLVDIRYRLISSQVEGNLVFPFYRELE